MTRRPALVIAAALLAASCTRLPAPATDAGAPTPSAGPAVVLADGDPIVAVVRAVRPAVVNVTATGTRVSILGGSEPTRDVGTGFIVRADGVIVTNWHVVEGAQRLTVTTSGESPERYEARVIGGDATADLAILQVEAEDLPTVTLGSSEELELGQQVVAIGYALALEGGPTVTSGIVSALDRTITVPDAGCTECPNGTRTYARVIQTDEAINTGNSGGPLLDLAGRVVGINTAGASTAENIGFAIAIDAALPTIRRAETAPSAPVAYLGVVTTDVTPLLAVQESLEVQAGAYVVGVSAGGPAEDAGLRDGDVIVAFDGRAVDGSDALRELIQGREPGEVVELTVVLPDGNRRSIRVTLGTNPLPAG
ncbi:MAG: S1C family serine protease [Actinomycetota bacterium]